MRGGHHAVGGEAELLVNDLVGGAGAVVLDRQALAVVADEVAPAHRRADAITAEFMDVGIGTEGGREIARLAVVEGEYNREESPRRVWDDFSPPNFGYPEAKGQTYQLTSEQFAVNQVGHYVKKLGAENHAGGANWIFSDSTSGGRVAVKVLPHLDEPWRDVFDAGRNSPEGTRERFTLNGLTPGRPLRLMFRAAPVTDLRIPVLADGKSVGTLALPRRDGWLEVSLDLPPPAQRTLHVELGPSGERVLYHVWAIQDF